VLLDEPKTEKWGSEAAAPIFAAIAAPVLRYLEVPALDATPIQIVTGPAAERPAGRVQLVSTTAEAGVMPDVRGRTLRQALTTLAPLRVRVTLVGRGRVAQQTPAAGEPVRDDAVVQLALAASAPPPGAAPALPLAAGAAH
jgi:cell division protein FtsI (penicillin-binding protein 3)